MTSDYFINIPKRLNAQIATLIFFFIRRVGICLKYRITCISNELPVVC